MAPSYQACSLHNSNVYEKVHGTRGCGSKSHHCSSSENLSYKLIETQSDVDDAVKYLQSCSEVSLDLEFDRDRFAYGRCSDRVRFDSMKHFFFFD